MDRQTELGDDISPIFLFKECRLKAVNKEPCFLLSAQVRLLTVVCSGYIKLPLSINVIPLSTMLPVTHRVTALNLELK
jgi:hypothetical protein